MRFQTKADIKIPEYVQVHIPPHIFNLDNSLRIEMYVNTSKAGDNSLLYLGDTSVRSNIWNQSWFHCDKLNIEFYKYNVLYRLKVTMLPWKW